MKTDRGIVVVLFTVAAAWRLIGLAAEGLWVDEAYTALLIRRSVGEILAQLRQDDAPALYYLLQKGVGVVSGGSETGVRLFSALCGCGVVLAGWAALRRHAPGAALAATAALATSPLLVFYSRQARSYALVHLMAVLLFWSVLELRSGVTRRKAAAFLAAALALLYSHNLGLLLLAPAGILVARPLLVGRRARSHGLLIALMLVAGAIPWAVHLFANLGVHAEGNAWMGAWWEQGRTLWLGPAYSWLAFVHGLAPLLRPPTPLPGWPAGSPVGWLALAAAVVGLVGALLGLRARSARGDGRTTAGPRPTPSSAERDVLAVALLFALIPPIGLVVASKLVGPAYVLGRTDTLALPAFLLLLALGWSRLPRAVGVAAVAIFCVAGLGGQPLPGTSTHASAKGSDRDLAGRIARQLGPRDALVCGALTRPTLEYYGRRQGWWDRPAWVGSFPSALDRNPAAVFPAPLDSAAAWQQQAVFRRDQWERDGVERIFLLAVRDPAVSGGSQTSRIASTTPPSTPWPRRPAAPPLERSSIEASALAYPANLLVSALAGLRPVSVEAEYRQDWVGGDRMLLRIDRTSWVPLDSIPRLEIRR